MNPPLIQNIEEFIELNVLGPFQHPATWFVYSLFLLLLGLIVTSVIVRHEN